MMKFWRFSLIALLAASMAFQGCKDKEEETKEYLTGKLSFDFPTYVEPGFTKDYEIDSLMTLSREDGGAIGYYFINPMTGKRDTLVSGEGTILKHKFTVEVPDTIANLNTGIGAFCLEEYYGTSKSVTFTIVKKGLDGKGSITNFKSESDEKFFIDDRDSRKYYYTDIDGVSWMRQNLAWEGAGVGFKGYDVMSDIFGRFYTWEEAVSACPQGWTLPSDEDWVALGKKFGTFAETGKDIQGLAGDIMGDIYFNDTKMWEFWRGVKITDNARLSVMPVGFASIAGGRYEFSDVYTYAAFWTSRDEGNSAGLRYIYEDKDIVYYGKLPKKDFAASVRCVKK